MEEDDYIYNLEDVGKEGLEDDTTVEMVITAPSGDRLVLISDTICCQEYRVRELYKHGRIIKKFMQSQCQSIQEEDKFFAQFE